MGERILTMTVSIVDTMLVGHLGAAALAAASLANEWMFVTIVLFWALSTGATTLVARSVGAQDLATANRAMGQSLLVGLLVGLVMMALAVALARPALALMGAEAEVVDQGARYLRVVAIAFPFAGLMYVGNACLRGAGDTRSAMIVMALVNLLNVIVAWIAINGPLGIPTIGILGSALGAAVGQGAGGLFVIGVLLKGRSGLKLQSREVWADWGMIKRVLRVGLPAGVEQMSWRLGMMVFVRGVASMGTTAVAAHAVALRAESLSYMPGFGFAVAGTALVGQYLGARCPDRAEKTGYITYQIAALVMTSIGLTFIAAPQVLIQLFSEDAAVIRAAVGPLRIIGFVQPLLAAAYVFPGALRGAGETRFPMIVTTMAIWAVRVPLALLFGLVLGWGLAGAWAGIAVDLVLRGGVTFLRFRGGRWKSVEV
jgi:putative MATE family efflux protein